MGVFVKLLFCSGPPCEAPCDTCKKEENKDLFHPSYLCFNRPRAKYLKANNLWKPPTAEQKEEMKRNSLQNHI